MNKPTCTIDHVAHGHAIGARDEYGEIIASRRTYCNPAALAQLLLDVERAGYEINWKNSQVAEPNARTA